MLIYIAHNATTHGTFVMQADSLKQKTDEGHQTVSVEAAVGKCMKEAKFPPSLLRDAKKNARYLYEEFRKIIPKAPLEDYKSYCWKQTFSIKWDKSWLASQIELGNKFLQYSHKIHDLLIPDKGLSFLKNYFPDHTFKSSLACLPKVFLAGFPKCGSSFTHCLLNEVISLSTYGSLQHPTSLKKEPHFWVKFNHTCRDYIVPKANAIGKYLFYFLPGLKQISELEMKDVVLVDSKVNKLFRWPYFSENQHNLTNYCLLPAVLPRLLPGSKFIVVLRNPVNMLFSAFWNSCTSLHLTIPMATQLRGPDLFHERVTAKIRLFNDCMRDSSKPSISRTCELTSKLNYTSCILHPERQKLLPVCAQEINFYDFSPEMPDCGRSRVTMGLYYVHIKKWLSVISKDRFHFIVLEDLIKNPIRNVHRLLEFLDLSAEAVTSNASLVDTVASSCNTNAQAAVDYKHDQRLQMRDDTRSLLEMFYTPFNLLLGQLVDHISSSIAVEW